MLRALAIVLVAASTASAMTLDARRYEHHQLLTAARSEPMAHFTNWMIAHAREYAQDAEELAYRFKVWMENLEFIYDFNAKNSHVWLGLNSLADRTTEEYRALLGFDHAAHKALNRPKTSFKYADVKLEDLPDALDWREKNAVTPVKNQAQCGSCWAFSTTGSVEGINAIFTKELVSLSEQELVDCDTEQDNGCMGGLMDYAFQFIMENGGLDTEKDYPYTAEQGMCSRRKLSRHVVSIDGYEDVPENDEAALRKAVAHQPVSVAIEADTKEFQLYMGGVFNNVVCGTTLDHGVLLVGYGKEGTAPNGSYWIIKNSWGPEWGEAGYIRIARDTAEPEGMCGVAMVASYPTKTHPNPPPGPDPGPDPSPSPGPGPGPGPVECDQGVECPAQTTCCCLQDILDFCLSWGCCPIPDATCCDDGQHCCPSNLPVCDTAHGRCLPGAGVTEGAEPWHTKGPATLTGNWFQRVWARFNRGARAHHV